MMDAPGRLRALDLFAGLDDDALDRLLASAREIACEAGEVIVKLGEPGDAFYLILEGDVQIFKRGLDGEDVVLARCVAGEFFGEQALIPGRPGVRTASARALGRTRLCRIDKAPFQHLLATDHPLKEKLLQVGDRQLLENLAAESRLFRAFRVGSEAVDERSFAAGEVIFRTGDPADVLYLILEGRVAIEREGAGDATLLATLGPGQCFGELGLMMNAARTARTSAAEDCRLMVVPAARYKAGLEASAELAELFRTLRRVYKLPRRGRLVQSVGRFHGRDAVTSLYELDDGRRVVTSRVVGEELYNADEVSAAGREPAFTTLTFVDEARQVRRELRLAAGGRLVGLTVHGPWELLSELQNRLLEGGAIDDETCAGFEHSGQLHVMETTVAGGVMCVCLQIQRASIKSAIRGGATRLAELQERLGCGTVCGGCLPSVRHLLGHEQWAPVQIVDEHQLTANVRRFRLRPVGRPMASAEPGQHVVLSGLVDGEWVRRSYTLTSAGSEPDHYEILVKREPRGVFSGWLFDEAGEDSLLRISPPQGDYYWKPAGAPAVCLAAGIGVTPALAMLRSRAREGWREPLHVDLSVRGDHDLVCADELRAAAAAGGGVSLEVRSTASRGRIQQPEVDALAARFPGADYYLCGPVAYMDAVGAMLARAGVAPARIHVESFTAAGERPAAKPNASDVRAPRAGGFMGLLRSLFRRRAGA